MNIIKISDDMKFIRNIFFGAGMLAAFAVTSCEDGLSSSSPSILTEEQVYSDPSLAEMGVLGIYETLTQQYSHRDRYLPWYGFNTDIECYNSTTYQERTSGIAQYHFSTTNTNMDNTNGNPYNSLIMGVERANLAIRGLETYADLTDPDMRYLRAEAYTARAFLYTELLKAYGEVPARFSPVTDETAYLNKANRDEIYKQLLKDLEGIFDDLPWPNQSAATSTVDRVSKAFAKGLYARLCLMASGYAPRPEDGLEGTGALGTSRLSNDSELQKSVLYPKALAQLEDVIEHSGLYLYPDFEQLWRDFNNFDLQAGKEVIFVIPFGNGRGRWNYTFAVPATAYTAGNNTQNDRGGAAGVVPTLYYKYAEHDSRRDVSCVNYEWQQDANGNSIQVPAGLMNWYFGKYRFDWMESHPFNNTNDDGAKPIYMRYADILLMAAEIAASPESSAQNLGNARKWFLEVRQRAFRGYESEAETGLDLGSPEGLFDAIVDERAFEFVGEFLRKADLIRWNMLYDKLNEAKADILKFLPEDEEEGTVAGEYASQMGPGLWYRRDADGVIEMYGIHPGERITQDAAPAGLGSGWICYTGSDGEPSDYFSTTSVRNRSNSMYHTVDTPAEGDTPAVTVNTTEQEFWQHVYWPIPQRTIDDQGGALKNDYAY